MFFTFLLTFFFLDVFFVRSFRRAAAKATDVVSKRRYTNVSFSDVLFCVCSDISIGIVFMCRILNVLSTWSAAQKKNNKMKFSPDCYSVLSMS